MPAHLVVHVKGRREPLKLDGPGPWSLGRSANSAVAFPDDPSCSRNQANIERSGDRFSIDNLSETAGLTVNNRPASKSDLTSGDVLRFANQTLTIEIVRDGGRQSYKPPARVNFAPTRLSHDLQIMRLDRDASKAVGSVIYLDHPTVSRRHARFLLDRNGPGVEDLGSTNGTRVNGRLITSRVALRPGDEIGIGVFTLSYDGTDLLAQETAAGAELRGLFVSKRVVRKASQPPQTLLDHVSVTVRPGTLVCIVGASGSGKTTLMNILSGRKRPSEGEVLLGNRNVHLSFDLLKQDMAYVPQVDILHDFLTLRQALEFAALLRLPRDLEGTARQRIVEESAESVGLSHRLDLKIGSLSGGQRKRASLAIEIMSRPRLLFLDEVTSGLDESTDREIMALLKRLVRRGMTIVCVTHTLANILNYADEVVVMGEGGILTFAGSPNAALTFFGITQLGEVFEALGAGRTKYWSDRFENSREPVQPPSQHRGNAPARPPLLDWTLWADWRSLVFQFVVLTRRNFALLLGDRRSLVMAAVQSLVVGLLLGYAYNNFGSGFEISGSKQSFLLVLGITCLWIGCAGSAKEIVGELPIYLRERDINLDSVAFTLSKFVVVSVFTLAQISLLLMACFALVQQIPGPNLDQFLIAGLASLSGAGLGFTISSIANSRDQAAVIVPLALAPQLILGSGLVSNLGVFGQWFAKLFIGAYWAREAMVAALISTDSNIYRADPQSGHMVAVTAHSLSLSIAALGLQTTMWILLTIGILYVRHSYKSE